MAEGSADAGLRSLSTPRAAALAGVVFALCFATSVLLLRSAIPTADGSGPQWVEQGRNRITVAVALMPLAGIAFLWFVGVVRDRVGALEDQFFSSVFLGSSLLFLAMVFVAVSVAAAVLVAGRQDAQHVPEAAVVDFGREVILQVTSLFAARMAAVCMVSIATVWLRTGVMARWLAAVTYVLALGLLVVASLDLYVTLIFPSWVFVVSVLFLAGSASGRRTTGA